jgi:hypothetical protein
VSDQPQRLDVLAQESPARSGEKPGLLARVLATAIVSTAIGGLATKLLGKRAGFVAFLMGAAAHEVLDAPLARLLGDLSRRAS